MRPETDKNDDRNFVFHAKGEGRGIHQLQLPLERIELGDQLKTLGLGVLAFLACNQRRVLGTKALSPIIAGGRNWASLVLYGGRAGGRKWISLSYPGRCRTRRLL
jgi:hypothetical protein